MVDFKKLTDRAKNIVEQRGGTETVKQDLNELKDIARGDGTAKDKLRDAAQALREPGAPQDPSGRPADGDTAAPAAPAPAASERPAPGPAPGSGEAA